MVSRRAHPARGRIAARERALEGNPRPLGHSRGTKWQGPPYSAATSESRLCAEPIAVLCKFPHRQRSYGGNRNRDSFKELAMRRYLLGLAGTSLALIGLAGSPAPARADHHGDHHSAWRHGHRGWDRDGYRWRGYYAPYPGYSVAPYYGYSSPYYGPY